MLRKLSKSNATTWYYKDGARVLGHPPGVFGNLTGVRGNLTGVRGELSGVWGDLSGVSGELTGVSGELTGVRGYLDDCEITQSDRDRGIDISELIAADAAESETDDEQR